MVALLITLSTVLVMGPLEQLEGKSVDETIVPKLIEVSGQTEVLQQVKRTSARSDPEPLPLLDFPFCIPRRDCYRRTQQTNKKLKL